jgi:hypothetical protein
VKQSPWEKAREKVLFRNHEALDTGVNFFVETLEKLGVKPRYSCEGHPLNFYVMFKACYDLAYKIANAGFFNVSIVKAVQRIGTHKARGKNWWTISIGPHCKTRSDKEQILSLASEAWQKKLLA